MPGKRMKIVKKKSAARKRPVRSGNVPATKAMLDKLEGKLTHELASLRLEFKSRFKQVDAKFEQLDSRFTAIDARFEQLDSRFTAIDARFDKMESQFEAVLAAVHRVGLLVEEQNARNKFVLDGYASLNDRIEKLERRGADKDL